MTRLHRSTGLFLFLILILSPRISAQSVSDVSFLPPTFYIGDLVEARIVIRDLSLEETVIPDSFPDADWITFREVLALRRPDGIELRISFIPYFVGSRTMPPIDIGGMVVQDIAVFVASILEIEGRDLSPMQDQILLPGTRLFFAVIAALLLVIPLLAIFAGGILKRSFDSLKNKFKESMPYRRLLKQLRSLEQEMHELDGRTFYIKMTALVRKYLEQRFNIRVVSSTTAELPLVLEKTSMPEEVRKKIVAVFRFGDLVKFANQRAKLDQRKNHLDDLRNAVMRVHRRRDDDVGA